MTPADRRITEQIDKWLASVDLHLQYVELSDAAYARAQPWPKHDRPTRWVLEVARQKILELKAHCETRQSMGDGRFAESLELMAFLANLVGIQHIQRFIPLADPNRQESSSSTPASSASMTVEAPIAQRTQPSRSSRPADDTTREMPRLKPAAAQKPVVAPVKTAPPSTTRTEAAKPAVRAQTPSVKTESAGKALSADLKNKMIADAVRLLKWGKPWHELAELIGRIADRPSVTEIRKFLRANKADIEARAAKAP